MQAGLIQRYLGNKSSISDEIVGVVRSIADPGDLVVDAFSGSLAVSFALRKAGLQVAPNDINHFSWLFATAFLSGTQAFAPNGRWASPMERRRQWRDLADELVAPGESRSTDGVRRTDIFDHYCEAGSRSTFTSARGSSGRRRFFSPQNAATIDRALSRLRYWWRTERIDQRTRCILSSMLITAVEKVSNTQGTYHDFPRQFMDSRSLRPLALEVPPDEIFLGAAAPLIGREEDSLEFVKRVPSHRVLYLDPPYNFRQYTTYYFMLNLLSQYVEIDDLDSYFNGLEFVRGQNMKDDFKSSFCSKTSFMSSMKSIVERADTDFVVISYFDGRNHWGSFMSDTADSQGRKIIEDFLGSDLFVSGSAACLPVSRLNYQSYGGHKAKTIKEFLFTARKTKVSKRQRNGEAPAWIGNALA
jgi:adenine-specific DNA methylase